MACVRRSLTTSCAPRTTIAALSLALTACEPHYPPPPTFRAFQGLPVSGSLTDARRAGFTRCSSDARATLRCTRSDIRIAGLGPYHAAVDLRGNDGRGGFDRLTVWYNGHQYELLRVGEALKQAGWRACYTGQGQKGDQAIYTRPDATVRVAIDLSYWMKRRLRLFREDDPRKPTC